LQSNVDFAFSALELAVKISSRTEFAEPQ